MILDLKDIGEPGVGDVDALVLKDDVNTAPEEDLTQVPEIFPTSFPEEVCYYDNKSRWNASFGRYNPSAFVEDVTLVAEDCYTGSGRCVHNGL